MSTPNPITFTPLTKGFSWVNSTTDKDGNPLPTGETQSGATVGIRADGDTAYAYGQYKYFVTTSGTASQLLITDPKWLAAKIPPGNYWGAVDQTDMIGTDSKTSGWSQEVPFSIPQPPPVIAQPLAPSDFKAA